MEDIKISVIIPFYNAREFIQQAVESVLQQEETGEILLIEDGSPDDGLEMCISLANKFSCVRLLRHPDGLNHGAAMSRNLGIINAKYDYIAFLDADDFFLPGRFLLTKYIFQNNENIDGVYNALGVIYESIQDKEFFRKTSLNEITSINKNIKPELLFDELIKIRSDVGYFSIDSLTVKKKLLIQAGYFNESLTLNEDTELIFRLAALGNLAPGEIINPVAVRRVHKDNRITQNILKKRYYYQSNIKSWKSLLQWSKKNIDKKRQYLIALKYIEKLRKSDYFDDYKYKDFFKSRIAMFSLAFEYPRLFFDLWFWRLNFPSKILFTK